MSDVQQQPDWWQASDGRWYPPQGQAAPAPVQSAPPWPGGAQGPPGSGPPVHGWQAAPPATGRRPQPLGWGVVVAAVVVMVAAFLPWATLDGLVSLSLAGTEADGVITLVLGGAAAVLGILRALGMGRWTAIIAVLIGLVILLIAIVDIADVGSIADLGVATASVGIGLWVTLVGAVAMVATAALAIRTP